MINIKNSFLLAISIMLIADNQNILVFFFISAIVHEFGHIIAVKLCNGTLKKIELCAVGAVIKYNIMYENAIKRYFVSIMGPAFSLIMAVIASKMGLYKFAGASFILGIFNLLPIYPLDGFSILIVIFGAFPKIVRGISFLFCVILIIIGAYNAICNGGLSIVFLGIFLVFTQKNLQI